MPYARWHEDLSIGEMECLVMIAKFTQSYSVTVNILRDGIVKNAAMYLTNGLYFVAITILIVERHYVMPVDFVNMN
jgi:hypothetical protein